MRQPILPLLFGGDINVYSMARAFFQAYGIRPVAYGRFATGPCYQSQIVDYRVCAQAEQDETFYALVCDYAKANPQATVLVIGCGDGYVKLAAQFKDSFPCNVIAPYVGLELMDKLTHKAQFYRLCDQYGIDHPGTFVHTADLGHDFQLPFSAPYICKPANGVAYWAHPFPGNEKVFLLDSREALEATLDKVYAAGYPDAMVIQEYIPGDDSHMRVLTSYSNGQGQVKLMCLGHVLLEEHSPHGIGNHAVILTQENPELCQKFQAFLEGVGFAGFSNFDIKYDPRDGKYKAFELNTRQGRSNYYVTNAGYNLAQYLVEDRVEGKAQDLVLASNVALWYVVPKQVAFGYTPSAYHGQMKALIRAGKGHNPLFHSKDLHPIRLLRMAKNMAKYVEQFAQYYKRPQ